jgi:hypothetical protein
VESICNYLIAPNGEVFIWSNTVGCNSQEEVEEACEAVDVGEYNLSPVLIIFPNPAHSNLTVKLPAQPSKNTILTLSNTSGQQLITQAITGPKTDIDIARLPVGIYIIKVWNDSEVMVQKIIKH